MHFDIKSDFDKTSFITEIKNTSEHIGDILEREIWDLRYWSELFKNKVKNILESNRSHDLSINKMISDILRKNGIY